MTEIDPQLLDVIEARATALQSGLSAGGTWQLHEGVQVCTDVLALVADMRRLIAVNASLCEPRQYVCPCCNRKTLQENPADGTYEICTTCWWEADPVQGADPDYPVGANDVSLNVARANYQRIGVSEERFIGFPGAPVTLENSPLP